MKSEVSVLLDGELERHEAPRVLSALKGDVGLRGAWCEYQTIGAALRHEAGLGCDITAGVMAALEDEATVLAPRPGRETAWQRPLVALAASAAGVAVVGWMALVPNDARWPARPSALAQSQSPQAVAAVRPAPQRDMQEYLLAHQVNAPLSRLQGGTQNIRMVSASGRADRR